MTVSGALPVFPSLEAMIFAVPGETAATTPVVAEIVATVVLSELHAIALPVRTFPFASRAVAVACEVPTEVIEAGESATVMEATEAGVTVTVAAPVLLSLVAMMFAVPAVTAVTTPVCETVATAELSELHATERPVRVLPLASFNVAVAWEVPIAVMLAGDSETLTVATGAALTVMLDVPVFPSLVAVIVAEPALIAVTTPLASTEAIPAALEDQITTRPVRRFPFESFTAADSC